MKFVWQISYPQQMVQVWVAIFVFKFDFSLKTLSKSSLNKPIPPFFEEAHIVTDGQTDTVTDRQTNSLTPYMGCADFLFRFNLLPPFLASLAGVLKTPTTNTVL